MENKFFYSKLGERAEERMHNEKIAIDNVYDSFEPSDIEFE